MGVEALFPPGAGSDLEHLSSELGATGAGSGCFCAVRLTFATFSAALALAPAAHAATATTVNGELRYTAVAGEANDVRLTRVSGNTFRVTEAGTTITAGAGCTQENPNQVTCVTSRRPVLRLGDLNDRAVTATSRGVILRGEDGDDFLRGGSGGDRLEGGNGNDQLFGLSRGDALRGGSGNDSLQGGTGGDSELGGSGDDLIHQGPTANGADTLDGQDGFDTLDYGARTNSLRIDVNGLRDDGEVHANERDSVSAGFDRVIAGSASDAIGGREATEELYGNGGGDVIEGRRGDDRIDGGPGIDQVRARDLSADTIVCGSELDSVAADERDTVAADCERVRRVASVTVSLAGAARSPTLLVRISCPVSAFKYCNGRLLVRTARRVPTRSGLRVLTVGHRRFSVPVDSSRVIGVRIRSAGRILVDREGSLAVRMFVSGYDGAGNARRSTRRFTLRD